MNVERPTEKTAPAPGTHIPEGNVWLDAEKKDNPPAPKAVPQAENSSPEKTKEAAQPKRFLASNIGKWAHEHKDYMSNNWLPWYGIRNAMASAFGITALVTILVPTRFGFGKLRTMADAALEKNPDHALARFTKMSTHGLAENIIGTGISFAGFRTGYKLWQRNYDRIFVKAKDEDDASKAVTDLPSNIAKDLRYLAPVEFPATLIAAVPLVAMRSGMRVNGNQFNKARYKGTVEPGLKLDQPLFRYQKEGKFVIGDSSGLVAAGLDSRVKDVIGSIPAYTAFFEFGERMFDDFQTRRGYNKNEHSHVKGVLHPSEQSKEKKPFDAMLEDTPARMYFYKVASVAAGIIPYITWSRYAQGNLKLQMKPSDSVWKAWSKEQGMFQGFALYTVGSEVARNNIDKLFQKLQDKELEKQGISK